MHISFRILLIIQGLSSAALLSFALISQYGFGLHPCHLCLLQRYPYAVVIAVSALGLAWMRWTKRNTHHAFVWLIALNLLLFLADAGIATYHAGVEAHIFPGPTDCTATGSGDSLEDLRAAIMNAPLVTCDQAMVHFLGLSMAAWNALAALALAAFSAIMLRKICKKDRP